VTNTEFRGHLVSKDTLPLLGKSVLFTTPRNYAGSLAGLLAGRGARPIWMPTIEIWPLADCGELDRAIYSPEPYDWIAFTSTNGIEAVCQRLLALGWTIASLRPARIVAFGPDADAMKPLAFTADLVPPEPTPRSMVETLASCGIAGRRVLVPVPEVSGVAEPWVIPEFIDELKKAGALVARVPAYQTAAMSPDRILREKRLLIEGKVDTVVFTSSAEILSMLEILGDEKRVLDKVPISYMGRATAKTGESLGLRQDIIPRKPAFAGLVEAIEDYFRPAARTSWRWPAKLDMIAMSGVGVEMAKTWTSVFEGNTGVKVNIDVDDDAVNRLKLTGQGLFDLTASAPAETAQMIMADRRYATRDGGPLPLRVVWTHSQSNSGFFVRGDSPIRGVYDVKPGTRIADISGYLAGNRMVEAFLAWAGISPEEIVWVSCESFQENVKAVLEGRADLSFGVPNSPVIFAAEKNPYGLRWLELDPGKDPEGARRFWEVSPLIRFGPVKFGVESARGISSAYGTSLYVTRAQNDTELVYHLAKWLDENHPKFSPLHPWNRFLTRDALMDELGHTFRPCHEGLIRYLKEKGLWTDAHDSRQAENVKLYERYFRAYREAIELADARQIAVSPENVSWVKLWEEQKSRLNLPPVRYHQSLKV